MNNIRRFAPRFLDTALGSPVLAFVALVLTVGPLLAGTIVWIIGQPTWVVFLVTAAAVPLVGLSVFYFASLSWAQVLGLPMVEVTERVAGTWAHLDVRNVGGTAGRFRALAKIIGGSDEQEEQYPIRWRETYERALEVNAGEPQVLNVAEARQGTVQGGDLLRYRDFTFHTARLPTGGGNLAESFDRRQVSDDGFLIEVTITSDPPLREPFQRTYRLREGEEPGYQQARITAKDMELLTPPNPLIVFERVEPT